MYTHATGLAAVLSTGEGTTFANFPATGERYANAQADDYTGLPRRAFPWSPPIALNVRARFSHGAGQLVGTAGFGFWNNPFTVIGGMTDSRAPSLPRAAWFFYASPPSDMAPARDVPGRGWKAAVIDVWRLPFFVLLPTAPLALPLMRSRAAYRALWPVAQRAIGVAEAALDAAMTDWHTYTLEWGSRRVRFLVDGTPVLETPRAPRGPLGLVVWLDNQYMVATPQGRFRHGFLPRRETQWMEVADLSVARA
jgi:hypothetical protein